jgi:hypothetical protein
VVGSAKEFMIPENFNLAEFAVDLPPLVKDWLFNSKDRLAEKWRQRLKSMELNKMQAARRRQEQIKKELQAAPPVKVRHIKRIGVIDPVIAADMRARYGSNCWNDRSFIEDTKKKSPELFVDPEKKK